jgi:hypothetical protein
MEGGFRGFGPSNESLEVIYQSPCLHELGVTCGHLPGNITGTHLFACKPHKTSSSIVLDND